jgi:hypothetical protein
MKLVVTADTHFYVDPERIPDGDVFIHCGDLMYTGYPDEWAERKSWLSKLPHKHKYLIPGNHDFHLQNYAGVARAELRKEAGVRVILPDAPDFLLPNGMQAAACSYVTGLRGWAFSADEQYVEDYLEQLPVEPDVMLTHAPMFNVLDAIYPHKTAHREQEHVGCLAFNRWFYRRQEQGKKVPLLWFCGHIHESYGHTNQSGTQFYNAAMCDRMYNQANNPMVIEL